MATRALWIGVEARLEAGHRALEALRGHEPVEAPHPPRLKALPPKPPQATYELLLGHAARQESGEAALLDVEADLHGDHRQVRMRGDELGEHVGAAAAGAPDEQDRRRLDEATLLVANGRRFGTGASLGLGCRGLGHCAERR